MTLNNNRHLKGKALKAYKESISLTSLQKEILVGTLLGDAYLGKIQNAINYFVKFDASSKKQNYIFHLYEIFKLFAGTPPKTRIHKIPHVKSVSFCTYSHKEFTPFSVLFYNEQTRKKIIPPNIDELLTPRALAYWFMDDGSFNIYKSTGKRCYLLNTQGYCKDEVELLCEVLKNKYNLVAKPNKDKIYWRIRINVETSLVFKEIVKPFII